MKKSILKRVASITLAFFLISLVGCPSANVTKSLQSNSQGSVVYFLDDHLGSTHQVTDSSGQVLYEESRYPYGGNASKFETEFESDSQFKPFYTYTGKEHDQETGLSYFGGRYYSPALSRWLTRDPSYVDAPSRVLKKPLEQNLYEYSRSNPVNFIDPDGFEPWPKNDFPNATMLPLNRGDQLVANFTLLLPTQAGTMALPVVNDVRDAYEYTQKKDLISGAPIGWTGRALAGVGLIFGNGAFFRKTIDYASSSIPARLSRVIDLKYRNSNFLGGSGREDVFITAAEDIAGINSSKQLAKRLTLLKGPNKYRKGPFQVIEFDTPSSGLASPINRSNQGFVGKGFTGGGAREFVLPNLEINKLNNVTRRIVP